MIQCHCCPVAYTYFQCNANHVTGFGGGDKAFNYGGAYAHLPVVPVYGYVADMPLVDNMPHYGKAYYFRPGQGH